MKVHEFITQMKNGSLCLPDFQRTYVWNKQKSLDLMDSLYQEYPIGSVTIWYSNDKQLIVDGQQRLSSIFSCFTDEVPEIHKSSNKKPPTGVYFDLKSKKFLFLPSTARNRKPMCVKISNILTNPNSDTAKAWRKQIKTSPEYRSENQDEYEECISKIKAIREISIPVLRVSNDRKSSDVVDMFQRMNTKGTTVKRWEIEMARMSIVWGCSKSAITSEAREYKNTIVRKRMNEEAIIRTMTALYSGRYTEDGLKKASKEELKQAFQDTKKAHYIFTQRIEKRLGIYDEKAVPTLATFPAISTYLKRNNMKFPTSSDESKALAYFILSGLGVFHGSTDNQIDKDVKSAANENDPWNTIFNNAKHKIGRLDIDQAQFEISGHGSARSFLLVHILQMHANTCDWHTGLPIRDYNPDELEKHHIFPKTHLQKKEISKSKINTIANIALITKKTNLEILDTPPEVYLAKIDDHDDGKTLSAHCLPRDRDLWKFENFDKFLEKRRKLMAESLNKLLNRLLHGCAV